jgi:hypothetical protein
MGSVLCDAVGRHACLVSNTVVDGPPGSKSVPTHHAGDRLGGLVLVGIPGVT